MIMTLNSPKENWDYLKEEYEGDEYICGMQVLNLMKEFEVQKMNQDN